MMSFFKAGPFGDYSNSDLGIIKFRPYQLMPVVTPTIPVYPAFAAGTTVTSTSRTWAGQQHTFPSITGGSQQDASFLATNILSSLGDWKDFTVAANYANAEIGVSGSKLTSFKIGDENATYVVTPAVYYTQEEIDAAQEGDDAYGKTTSDIKTPAVTASNVTTNIHNIKFPNNYCLLTIDARNASSISGAIDLSNCTRLRSAYFGGTSITGLSFADGQKIETVELPDTATSLVFRNHSFLTTLTLPADLTHADSWMSES